ncbi:MAG: SDR family oxidoreductase [Crocinitomicaceae bacterium]|nr:SDR family oxidoreductase [Crocinitomicaceae bacterium]
MKDITILTGGAGGMGLATAKILGQNHHIVLCDLKQDNLSKAAEQLQRLGIESTFYICDITDQDAVNVMFNKIADQGRIASVIHTAGVSPQMGKADMIMRINALGTINITEAFIPYLSEGACMINISSMAGYFIPNFLVPKRAFAFAFSDKERFYRKALRRVKLFPKKQSSGLSYSISKNFVSWYSMKSAAKFGAKGARIISISPGSFDTEMGHLEEKSGSKAMLEFAAIKRFGKPEEIAELIAFCVSDRSSYTTGIDIPCDGGVIAGFSKKNLFKMMRN